MKTVFQKHIFSTIQNLSCFYKKFFCRERKIFPDSQNTFLKTTFHVITETPKNPLFRYGRKHVGRTLLPFFSPSSKHLKTHFLCMANSHTIIETPKNPLFVHVKEKNGKSVSPFFLPSSNHLKTYFSSMVSEFTITKTPKNPLFVHT